MEQIHSKWGIYNHYVGDSYFGDPVNKTTNKTINPYFINMELMFIGKSESSENNT